MRKLLILLVLAVLLLPIALIAVLFYSQTGVELIAQQLPRLERFGVRIEGVSGTLSGPLFIERFELDHPRVHIVSRDIVIDPQLRALLLQTIRTRSATARETRVEIRAADMPPSDRPPRFLPPWMRIDARGVELTNVNYVHLNGASIDATSVRGRVSITTHRLRVRSFAVDAPTFDAAGDLRLEAGRPLELQGAVAGRVRIPRAEFALEANVDGPIDQLAIEAELLQPSRASVTAMFTRPDDEWRLEGKIASPAFALNPFLDRPPFSLREVALDVTATAADIHAVGSLIIPELHENTLTLDAHGGFAARVLRIASADVALQGAEARVHASGTVEFQGESPTLDLRANWRTLQWPLTAEPLVMSNAGEATLRGELPYEFSIDAQVEGPDIPSAQGAAVGLLSKELLTVTRYDLEALDGVVSGAATLEFSAPREWTLSARASEVNPATLHDQFPGALNFLAAGSGAGLDRDASFSVEVSDLNGLLRGERVRGGGSIQKGGRRWTARGVDLHYGDAHLVMDGSLDAESVDASWSLNAASLDALLPQAAGSIDFSGEVSGARSMPNVIATVRGENLRYQEIVAKALVIDANLDAAGTRPSKLQVSASQLGRGQPWLSELRMNGAGLANNHRIDMEVTGLAPDTGESPSHAVMQIAGSYEDEVWNATVTTTELTRGADADRAIRMAEPARIMASREQARLENLCVLVGDGRVCADGAWRAGGAWDATVAGYEIPLAFVLPPSGEEADYAGRIEGRIRLNGAPDRPWEGDAGMRIIDAAVIYRPPGAPPQTLNLGTGGLAATATPARIEFSFGVQAFADTFLYANANLLRDGADDVLRMPLTGDIRARAADANILPLLFPEIDHAAGLLTAEANIVGSLAAPEVSGRVELANGEFDSYRVNLGLRELSLVANLSSQGFDFRSSGSAGEGRLEADGRFSWRGGEMQGALVLNGKDLLVADLPEYRVVASPDLHFRIDGERILVAGDVTIPSALVQPDQLTGAVRASDDARFVGEHPAEQEGRYAVRSEVRITMGDDVRVDAFGLQGRITGSVGTTIETGETAIGRGELGVSEGRYAAFGQDLEISRGQLLFDASPLVDPGIDIEARRTLDTTTVGLNVRGTLQQPRVTFFSDPSMPQTQILALLLTGRSGDALQGVGPAQPGSTGNALAVQGGGLLVSELGRHLGLDEVGVESELDSAGESNQSLVLGKFLSPRLFISYGISLTEAINTLKVRYTISDRWLLRTEAGEHQSVDVEFTVER